MKSGLFALKQLFSLKPLVALIGYALYRTVSYNSYVTGFSLANKQVGYIFDPSFLAAASFGIIPTALLVAVCYTRRPYVPLSVTITVPTIAILCSYLLALTGTSLFDRQVLLILLGLTWGVATCLLSMAWAEILAINSSPLVLIVQMASASLFSAILGLILPAGSNAWSSMLCCIFLICSLFALRYCRNRSQDYEAQPGTHATLESLKQISIPVIGSLLFELVIGMVNMYMVFSGNVDIITASSPLLGMILCALLTIIFVFVSTKFPNPSLIYLGVFPVIIAIFLLLPFVGIEYGTRISPLFYTGYMFTTLITSVYYYRAAFVYRAKLYVVFAVVSGCTRLSLIIGLLTGYLFSTIQQGDEVLHLAFIAVASAYLLGIAIVAFVFNALRARGEFGIANGKNVQGVSREDGLESYQEATLLSLVEQLRRRANALASEYHLTNRECDVLIRLALGNSARFIAEDLVLSTSTVNGYVKSIYSKLQINKKQQVMDMFNDIISAPDPMNIMR